MIKICPQFNANIERFRVFQIQTIRKMKYLNVAEKNDAAKTIAGLLSNGSSRRREGLSVYNKIYDFEYTVRGSKSKMVMTSVSGHLLQYEFISAYKNWRSCDPLQLFDASVLKTCNDDYLPIKRTLEREIKSCQGLILWTDCDREGENIAFEIINVCRAIKPNITVHRAKFSEITSAGVRRAIANLVEPDKRQSDAVDIRSELDLRTGAAITRFQTMRLQRLFPEKIADKLISYGSCQIPTLGFVAERYKEVEAFVSEAFWKIKVTHTIAELTVDFNWARNRLFDKDACEDYLLLCLADPKAKVENVTIKPKNKRRPTPMDTVEMEKLGSRKLKLSAKETMTIAEKLYTQGIISYPRTETNAFSKEIDLKSLVEHQVSHSQWGEFAQKIIEWGPNPRNGSKSDEAHPPIHPTKLVTNLTGNEARVYELITRHFLACVSKDATGCETIVNIDIAGEKFTATGLCIYERNYLDVYIYEKWNARQIHKYEVGQEFEPTEISMEEGATTAPPLLTEADLISLMEKHGIGTDATHAEHINTIKERGYIGEIDRGFLVPGVIGMGLYEGYDAMELVLARPMLRAEFEADLKKICLGQKDPKVVLQEQILKYKDAYRIIKNKIEKMDEKMAIRINATPQITSTNDDIENWIQEVFECPKCLTSKMALKKKKDLSGYYIGCLNYPNCKNVVWFTEELKDVSLTEQNCARCRAPTKMLKVKLNLLHRILFDCPDGWYTTCLRCDSKFRETFNINADQVKRVGAIVTDDISASTNHNKNLTSRNNNERKTECVSSVRVSKTHRNQPTPTTSKFSRSANPKQTTKTVLNINGCTISETTMRKFVTHCSEPIIENTDMRDFFDCNDGFDDLLLQAEDNNVIKQSSITVDANHENLELGGFFMNDDFEEDNWSSTTAISAVNSSIQQRSNVPRSNVHYEWGTRNKDIQRCVSDVEIASREPNENQQFPTHYQSESIRCIGCNQLAKERTVKKEGHNKGRLFYVCSKTKPCNFFQWADVNAQTENMRMESNESLESEVNIIKCNCQVPASSLIVHKDGPNRGRKFYGCSDRNKSCGFFKWAEEAVMGVQSEYSWGTSHLANIPSGSRVNTRRENSQNRQQKRKCGICREEGHTRSKCPRKGN